MNDDNKRAYITPEMEILNARVERGFAESSISSRPINNPSGNDCYTKGDGIGYRFS